MRTREEFGQDFKDLTNRLLDNPLDDCVKRDLKIILLQNDQVRELLLDIRDIFLLSQPLDPRQLEDYPKDALDKLLENFPKQQ